MAATDTTALDYKPPVSKSGLGPIGNGTGSRGLFYHAVLAVTPGRRTLGLLGVRVWTRERHAGSIKGQRRAKLTSEKGSGKWLTALWQIAERLPASQRVLLVEDREADVLDFLSSLRREGLDLLVRAAQDRRVQLVGEASPCLLYAAAQVGCLTVHVPARAGQVERDAQLTVRAREVEIQPPDRALLHGQPVRYWLLQAREETPPEAGEALSWVLLTTLDRAEPRAAQALPGHDAARWEIERLHSTLKSGLGVERLQTEDLHVLANTMAVLSVTVWRVVSLAMLSRMQPELDAAVLFSADELEVLATSVRRPVTTVGEATAETALLAGNQAYRPASPPGLKRVWSGLRRLADMLAGYRLARDAFAGNGGYKAG